MANLARFAPPLACLGANLVGPAPARASTGVEVVGGGFELASVRVWLGDFVGALGQLRGFWELSAQFGQSHCKIGDQYLRQTIARLEGRGLVSRENIMKNLAILGLLVAAGAAHAVTYTYSGAAYAIPDNNVAGISTQITGVPALASINSVSITMAHTWVGDLILTLSNGSQTVNLINRTGRVGSSGFGDSSDLGGTYVFQAVGADFVAAAFAAGASVPTGTYASSDMGTANNSSTPNGFFSGAQAAADWTLFASDNAGGDTGGIETWSIDGSPVPEPTTMAALGLGLAAVARRRRNKK